MHSGLNRAHYSYTPLIALDHGYLILAGHPIGGATRFDGKPEAWLIDRREFEAAFSAGLGKASPNSESQWQSLVAIVEWLEKGDHSKAQAIVDWIENSAPKNPSRIHFRDTVSRALKPITKNASSHPPLSVLRQKFNPNHDALGRFTFGSGGHQRTATGVSPNFTIEDIDFSNGFHDHFVEYWKKEVLASGGKVITNITLTSISGAFTARADMLVIPREQTRPFFVEVKTGESSTFTPMQSALYPLLQVGGHVRSRDFRIAQFGLIPGAPLPPMEVFVIDVPGPGRQFSGYFLPPPTFVPAPPP